MNIEKVFQGASGDADAQEPLPLTETTALIREVAPSCPIKGKSKVRPGIHPIEGVSAREPDQGHVSAESSFTTPPSVFTEQAAIQLKLNEIVQSSNEEMRKFTHALMCSVKQDLDRLDSNMEEVPRAIQAQYDLFDKRWQHMLNYMEKAMSQQMLTLNKQVEYLHTSPMQQVQSQVGLSKRQLFDTKMYG